VSIELSDAKRHVGRIRRCANQSNKSNVGENHKSLRLENVKVDERVLTGGCVNRGKLCDEGGIVFVSVVIQRPGWSRGDDNYKIVTSYRALVA